MVLDHTVTLWQTDTDMLAAVERHLAYALANGLKSALFVIKRRMDQGADPQEGLSSG